MSGADRSGPNTTLILTAAIAASAMAFIDGSIVNIALPVIQRGLGADLADLQWVSNAYLLLLGDRKSTRPNSSH